MLNSFKLFLDCDGVLADFDRHAETVFKMHPREFEDLHGQEKFWSVLKETEEFFFNIPLMSEAMYLWNSVKHLDPHILTGVPTGGWAEDQKIRWANKHFKTDKVITCKSRNKRDHMVPNVTNIIIDDWPRHKGRWEETGGIFIVHTSVENSLNELRKLKVL